MKFLSNFRKTTIAVLTIFVFSNAVMAAEDMDIHIQTAEGAQYTLTLPTSHAVDVRNLAEDELEPLDLYEAEEMVSLSLADGTIFDIPVPTADPYSLDAGLDRSIQLETADGTAVSIVLPPTYNDGYDDGEVDGYEAHGTMTITLPDGLQVAITSPRRYAAASAAQTKPKTTKPDRVGVGEDTTDVPELNDPEGLIIKLPGGTVIETQTR